jgi:tRNA threonylcarbamoyladenosine biosynthesis protein TsaB
MDLTSEHGSLALVEDGQVLGEVVVQSKDGYGHVMFPPLTELLGAHQWTLDSIDCFAVAHGPGSFTGVRVGVAAAKGFAAATSKPIVCVSNLRAIASFGSAPMRVAILDAHREEVFCGLYDGDLNLLSEELVTKPGPWLETIPEGAEIVRAETVPQALAGAVGRIAAKDFKAGKTIEAAAAEANYVRRSDAEMFVSSYRPLLQSK